MGGPTWWPRDVLYALLHLSRLMTTPTKWPYAQRRLRSAWVSAQSDQSSLCAQRVAKDPSFLHADSEDWSDWTDAQADPSLRMPFCWFCHEAAHLALSGNRKSKCGLYLVSCDVLYFCRANKRHIYATPLWSRYSVWLHYKCFYHYYDVASESVIKPCIKMITH